MPCTLDTVAVACGAYLSLMKAPHKKNLCTGYTLHAPVANKLNSYLVSARRSVDIDIYMHIIAPGYTVAACAPCRQQVHVVP